MAERSPTRLISLLLALTALVGVAPAQAPELPDFEIEDQFEKLHTRAQLAGAGILVIASGREGREANAEWGNALRSSLADEIASGGIRILPVADVRGVPFFLKGRIRGRFPEDPERWILLDWDGLFAETFDLDGDVTTVLLFGPSGRLISKTAEGFPDEVRVRIIAALAREALETS